MRQSKIDVPVLIIFFNRPSTLQKVFDAVKEAAPSTLLLWQDGPREGNDNDVKGIEECRNIVENIDWDCKVYKNYHEKNFGCDPSTFYSHKWAFSLVEKCIILEDDLVPSQSFFPYCKELLDKYEFDERINHICGLNLLDDFEKCPYDYMFSINGTGVWGSWQRVAKGWDETYSFLHDEYAMKNLRRRVGKRFFDTVYKVGLNRESIGKSYWETILGFDCLLNNRLAIVPKKNMVSNIGTTEGSTHSNTKLHLLPKKIVKTFNMKQHEISFPLKHPKYVVPDYDFMDQLWDLMCLGQPSKAMYYRVRHVVMMLLHGEFGMLKDTIRKKL